MKWLKRLVLCVLMTVFLFAVVIAANSVVNVDIRIQGEQVKNISEKEMKEWAAPDMKMLDYYGLGEFSTTLPVVYLNTKGQQILKENKIFGTVALLEADENGQSVFQIPNSIHSASINYRGASSYSEFDKKQYKIKFYDNKLSEEKNVSLAGMGRSSEWVLNGPYLDKTLMRNKLCYDLARELNGWAPDSRFVEVFTDGRYEGVYLAVEAITNGDSRLRLSKFSLLSGECAYIVNRNRLGTEINDLETYGYVNGYTNNTLYLTYPSENKVTVRQRDYIQRDISQFEEILYGEYFTDSNLGYETYIDMDNWVDYFIINEVSMNHDAGNLSTYIYKELGGDLQLAVWDFNNSFDNYQWFSVTKDEFNTVENSWMNRVCQDRVFVDRVVERYKELRKSTFSDEHIQEMIDSYRQQLGDSAERNFAVWGYSFEENLLVGDKQDGSPRDAGSHEEAIEHLENAIHSRLGYLDENIDILYKYCKN